MVEMQAGWEGPQGMIELYSHNNGRIGVMVEVGAESEAASRSEALRSFAHEIALQITSAAPLYVRDEDIPQAVLDELEKTAAEKARAAGKPERVVEKIVVGILEKYKNEKVLLRQMYIRDENLSVAEVLSEACRQVGEAVSIRRFLRWEVVEEAAKEGL